MRRLVVALALAATACTPSTAPAATVPPTASPTAPVSLAAFSPSSDAVTVEGGCGSTRVWKGSVPADLERAAGQNAPHGLPIAFADPPVLAGFVFGYPLRAGPAENPSNKVLWVVSGGRTGPLVVDAHPAGATAPTVHYSFPDNSGPGNIYPSGVDVPSAGCWHLTFTWSGHTASIDLLYR